MDANYNVTAVYDDPSLPVEFKVTVRVPSDPSWLQNFTANLWDHASYYGTGTPIAEAWLDNNTVIRAGIKGFWLGAGVGETPTPCVYGRHTNEVARFVNWSDVGYYISDPWAWSNDITVNGPMTLEPDWEYVYRLYATDEYTNGYVATRPEDGWYAYSTVLNITAAKYTFESWHNNRWRFNHWEVDGNVIDGISDPACVKAFAGENITIHIDGNHTLKAMYTRQWYVEFSDNISGWSCVSSQDGYYDENKNQTFTAPQYCNQTSTWRYRFNRWYGYNWPPGWFGNLTNRSFTVNVTMYMAFYAEFVTQWHVQIFTDPVDAGLLAKCYLKGWVGDPGWFDDGSTASFGAPLKYGETEWANGTRLIWLRWDSIYGPYDTVNNNTSWGVWRDMNFTAVYKKQFTLTLSAVAGTTPIPKAVDSLGNDFTWQGKIWVDAGLGTWWMTAPSMYMDPAGWVWLFDYWETSPYGNLAWWSGGLYLDMNTTYTAIAHYRHATGFVVDPRLVEFETAGNAYCHTFKVSIYATNVKELYSLTATLTYNPTYLEIVNIDATPLTSLGWFVADWDWVNDGSYELIATAVGNETNGLTGGAIKLVEVTFHIIYEPCTPVGGTISSTLGISGDLWHKNMTSIPVEMNLPSTFNLKVLKPALMGYTAFTDSGKKAVIDIYAANVTKLYKYYVKIIYDTSELSLKSYEVITTFFPGPGLYTVNTGYGPNYFSITLIGNLDYLANGTGPIVRLVFDVKVPGSAMSAIQFDGGSYFVERCTDPVTIYPTLLDMYMPPPLAGDANRDGVVDVFDLRLVAYYMNTRIKPDGPAPPTCDVYPVPPYGDHCVNIYDLIWVARNFGRHL
jgi:hypothetical protein